ncbi:MAG: DsrE family protein, partial [Candidatus Zixiibacteriota bacterium]
RTAVLIAKESCQEHVFLAGLNPLEKLVDTFVEQGGKIRICTPCVKERQISEDMLVETVKPVTSGRAVQTCTDTDTAVS